MSVIKSVKGALLATAAVLSIGAASAQDSAPSSGILPQITDEIVVRGTNIPDPQRATAQVATFLNQEDLARAGDANAALALSRLSGLSVIGGKFAYVRGLGDRYSSALLNGSPLPSPEPLRRTVPLDLFPSNILNGAAVQKTFSPDYPGEFGGGIINLETLREPAESFLNVRLGTGFNLVTTGRNGLTYRGGNLDFLGFDDGTRSLPINLRRADTRIDFLPDAEREALFESFPNSELNVIQEATLGPDFQGSIDGGTAFERGGATIGIVGVVGFDGGWETQRAIRQTQANGIVGTDLDPNSDAETNLTETQYNATLNGLTSVSAEWDDHFIQATALYIHTTTKEAQIFDGIEFNAPFGGRAFDESTIFIERDLKMGQLSGEHVFGDFGVDWRAAYARSTRDSPFERTLRRIRPTTGADPLYLENNNYDINFSELDDDLLSGGLDLSYDIPLQGGRFAKISVGGDYSKNDRRYDIVRLQEVGGNSLPDDVQSARPDFLFSPDNIGPNRFELSERTLLESYIGDLEIISAYFKADFELIPTVNATVGVRYEDSTQEVQTISRLGVVPGRIPQDTRIDEDYFLPSVTVTWNAIDDLQLRVGYSQTITRPQFRELAESLFFDPDTERQFIGSGDLVNSEITNYDVRAEYYLGRNQFVTLAGFYKQIDNPIEEVIFEQASFVFGSSFINSPEADLFGVEFEYRSEFQMPIDNEWIGRRDWLFTVNYTYTNSEVSAEEGEFIPFSPLNGQLVDASTIGIDGRELQGTPEHIVNTQFGWEGENDQLTILLGWVSERILQRGYELPGTRIPDIIEEPGVQLDLVYRYDIDLFGQPMSLGLSGRNLLATRHEEFQISDEVGRTDFNTYDRGRTFSASITARF
ncbi:MAG: TonB-dependent receptor [Pseudomonadota bacterium]